MRRMLTLLALLASLLGAATPKDVTARWVGTWTAPEGWVYQADAVLEAGADNKVTGAIQWTLVKSPRPAEQGKLGLTGLEFVRGTFLPEAGMVRLEGWSLSDPNQILGMDRYRLILSDDGAVLGGITYHNGPWTGQILLRKQ